MGGRLWNRLAVGKSIGDVCGRMKEIRTEIEIAASEEDIWRTLINTADFPDWNPFIRRVSGVPHRGARLSVTLRLPGVRRVTFRPVVTAEQPKRELTWIGAFLLPGLLDVQHRVSIVPLGYNPMLYSQHILLAGLLVSLLGKRYVEPMRRGAVDMDAAIKARVERRGPDR